MHELSIIKNLVECVEDAAAGSGASKVVSVSVDIGELSDIDEDMMVRYFAYVTKGTMAEGAILGIRRTPILVRCMDCEEVYRVASDEIAKEHPCPACGASKAQLVAGREMTITGIEAE